MKLDVLDTLPTIQICTGYRTTAEDGASKYGSVARYWQGDAHWLGACEPVYERMEGWNQSTRHARRLADLPPTAQRYIDRVAELSGVPVSIVSVGPRREETIQIDR
jgi:adenylosuccinate synthase